MGIYNSAISHFKVEQYGVLKTKSACRVATVDSAEVDGGED